MTTPKPTPVVDPPENAFESFLTRGVMWINEHGAEVAAAIVAAVLLGGASAGLYEWFGAQERSAHEALAKVEAELVRELGGDPTTNNGYSRVLEGGLNVPTPLEPADAARASAARETALKGFASVAEEHDGTFAAMVAQIRAAEVEIQLKRWVEADTRLVALLEEVGSGDPVRGIALHMRGGVLDELDRAQEAAQVYADAGAIADYPGRVQAWLAAAQTYERLGMRERTLESYEAVSLIAPEFSEQAGLIDRIDDLRAAVGEASPAAGAAESGNPG